MPAEAVLTQTKREQIAAELETIRQQDENGLLHPEAVVTWAKSHRESVLHAHFTWDKNEAAAKWLIHEAQQIIRIVVLENPQTARVERIFVSLPSDRIHGGGYRKTDDALIRARQEMVNEALKKLLTMRNSFTFLPELDSVWNRVQEIVAEFQAGASRQAG